MRAIIFVTLICSCLVLLLHVSGAQKRPQSSPAKMLDAGLRARRQAPEAPPMPQMPKMPPMGGKSIYDGLRAKRAAQPPQGGPGGHGRGPPPGGKPPNGEQSKDDANTDTE